MPDQEVPDRDVPDREAGRPGTLADVEPGLAAIGRGAGGLLRGLKGDLHARLLDTIRATMREQGRSLRGGQGRGLALGVESAVDAFVEAVADPGRDLAPTRAVFHALGRTEYAEGHRVDALRSVLTVGARVIWAYLVEHAPGARLPPADLYVLASALFGFMDELAGAAAEGYLDEQQDAALDWTTTRRRLITLLVQADPPGDAALHAAAEAARWALPRRVAIAAVDGTDADHLARGVGGGAISTVIDDAVRIVVPEPDVAGRVTGLRHALAGRRAAVGPTVALRDARLSYRLSGRALQLVQAGLVPAAPGEMVLHCDEHLLTLLTRWEPGFADHFAARLLAPLDALGAASRRVLAETLLAWLRAQGQVVPTAAALPAHPQTVRYRMRKLRAAFGAALDDPETRLHLHLALLHRCRPGEQATGG